MPPMIWKAWTVMPKNLKRKFPATRNVTRTATEAAPETKAMRARVLRDAPSVRAMNDGTTANGFTIDTIAAKASRATR